MFKIKGRFATGAIFACGSLSMAQVPVGPLVAVPVERPRRPDVVVRAPFVQVRLGRDVNYPRPVVGVAYQIPAAPAPGPLMQQVPLDPRTAPPAQQPQYAPGPQPQYAPVPVPPTQGYVPAVPVPQPVVAAYLPARPMTHKEFAQGFVPREGTYDVTLIHPKTCLPVRVCFTLPCGTPKRVRAEKHELEFDYGRTEVEIRFKNDGTVKVNYKH